MHSVYATVLQGHCHTHLANGSVRLPNALRNCPRASTRRNCVQFAQPPRKRSGRRGMRCSEVNTRQSMDDRTSTPLALLLLLLLLLLEVRLLILSVLLSVFFNAPTVLPPQPPVVLAMLSSSDPGPVVLEPASSSAPLRMRERIACVLRDADAPHLSLSMRAVPANPLRRARSIAVLPAASTASSRSLCAPEDAFSIAVAACWLPRKQATCSGVLPSRSLADS